MYIYVCIQFDWTLSHLTFCIFIFGSFALDLIALNIQRGRDHGLPSYLDYRKFFGLSDVKSFEDLKAISRPEDVEVFKTVYRFENMSFILR